MAVAVSAWFDGEAEAAVRGLWRRLADAGVDASLHDGPYRPHVTLGVWEELPVEAASARLATALTDVRSPAVTFRAIGIFPASRSARDAAVWLAPTVTGELRPLHERVHAALAGPGKGASPRCEVDGWNPHCTVAWHLAPGDVARAVDVVLAADLLPLPASIDRVGLVETPAEVELACVLLGGVV